MNNQSITQLLKILNKVSRRDCEIYIDDIEYTYGIHNVTHLEPIDKNNDCIERISIENDIEIALFNDNYIHLCTKRGHVMCMCFKEKIFIPDLTDDDN
jgi:hypothetical protein